MWASCLLLSLSGAVAQTFTFSVSGSNSFTASPCNPSDPLTFRVSMSNQPNDVAITVPNGFEVRVGSGTYQPTGSIPAATTTITADVRLSGQVPGNSSGFVQFAHAGGTASYNVSGTTIGSSAVVLTSSPNSLSGFSTVRGTPSASQTYTLTGCNLSTPVVISPPAGFAVSTDGVNFSPTPLSLPLGQTPQTIFARLTGDADGSFSGTIANETTGASAPVMVSGTVSSSTIVSPPGPQPLQLIDPTYTCQTGAFRFNTTGGDGTTITYMAVGITGPTTNPNDDVDTQLAQDIRDGKSNVEPIRLFATQSGQMVDFLWDALAACSSTTTTPPPSNTNPPPSNTSVCGSPANTIGQSLQEVEPIYNCQTGDIKFNTTGGDGSVITYFAVGIVSETTNCFDKMDSEVAADVRNDRPNVQPFTLGVRQNGQTAYYVWDARAYCRNRSARSATEATIKLQVTVLTNPTERDEAEVVVTGAYNQSLQLVIVDASGRVISQKAVGKSATTERQTVRLGATSGLYLLRVSTSDKAESVRIMKK